MSVPETIPFTEFIQRPTAAISRLTRVRALRLRRRDADDLVVMPADRADQEREVIELTARLLASLLRPDDGHNLNRQALPEELPTVRYLPHNDVAWQAIGDTDAAQA